MSTLTLLASAAFALISATAFTLAGRAVSARQVEGEAERAITLFATWWHALALVTALGGLQSLAGALGWTWLPLWAALQAISFLILCIALLGLLYYLLYLYTGRSGLLAGLAIFYVVYYLYLLALIYSADPVAVEVGRWTTTLTYADPSVLEGPLASIALVLLVAPQILGALALFGTFFRLEDPTRRYRVALVSWAIVIWFGSSLLASLAGVGEADWWQILSRAIGLAAALAVLAAYQPPAWIQQRLGVRPAAREGAS